MKALEEITFAFDLHLGLGLTPSEAAQVQSRLAAEAAQRKVWVRGVRLPLGPEDWSR